MAVTSPPALNGADPIKEEPGAQPSPDDVYRQIASLVDTIPDAIRQLDLERTQIAARYQQRLDAISEERRAALEVIDSKKRELNGLLRHMGREPVQTPVKSRRPPSATKNYHEPYGDKMTMKPGKALLLLNTILLQNGPFATKEIHVESGADWNDTSTHAFFAYLRTHEYIRRKRRQEGMGGAWLYDVWSRDRLVELRDEVQAKVGEA